MFPVGFVSWRYVEMINLYNPKTLSENKAALREILQSIVLIGLSRADFLRKHLFMVELL